MNIPGKFGKFVAIGFDKKKFGEFAISKYRNTDLYQTKDLEDFGLAKHRSFDWYTVTGKLACTVVMVNAKETLKKNLHKTTVLH